MPRSVSRSPSRGRSRSITPRASRSPSPVRRRSYSPRSRSRSPRRSISPRRTRSPRRSMSPRRSISPRPRRNGNGRRRSYSRSPSPPLRSTKIVVEKLTKNVNESHLRELFEVYGEIVDMDLPINRTYGTNRGTAYILYRLEDDANQAIAHMHESQLDGAVISVSVVIPRERFSPGPPMARRGPGIGPRGGGPGLPDARPPRRRSPRRRDFPKADTYRPRTVSRSRSRSPRAHRSRSRSYSRSRSPPRRKSRRDSAERPRGRGRSRSADSYGNRRSLSRDRSPRRARV